MTATHSDLSRNVVVAVLAAVIIAVGSGVILHGKDIVELRSKSADLEKQVELLTQRVEKLQYPN